MHRTPLHRYTPLRSRTRLKPSRGTVIPSHVRNYVYARDGMSCALVGLLAGHQCWGGIELDHVRASGGVGMKSRSTADNLVCVCSRAHQWKSEHPKEGRSVLLAYLERVEGPAT